MNKDFLKIINQLNQAEKLTSLAVIEQVKKLTKLNEENKKELEAVLNAYEVLKTYYEGMPLEKEIAKISEIIEDNLNQVHEKSEATDKEIKTIALNVDKLFKEIARVEKIKPKELTKTIIERIQEIPLELSKEKKDEIIAETQTEENISKIIDGINNLPITPEQQIDASHIKNLPDIDSKLRSIGVSNKYLAQLLDVDLSGLTYTNGKYVLGSGSGGGTFLDLTDTPSSYTGQALKVLQVNAGETALEFVTLSGGGDALTANPLSQFASTTSLQLAGVISDETGTGSLVFADTPTFTTRINVPDIRANGSGGFLLEASNGTDIGQLGAGNTANVTWYGSHNFDTVTASRVAQFGASKTLESSSVTTTELGYLSGVTSAIQTQLNAKQAQDVFLDEIAALTDPGADRIMFRDHSAGTITWLTVGTGLQISGTTLFNTVAQAEWGGIGGLLSDQIDLQTALDGKQTATLSDGKIWIGTTGDVTTEVSVSGDASLSNTGVLTIANDAVTFAKFQNITDNRLLGRSAGSTGDMQEISIGSGLSLSGGTLSATGGGSGDVTKVGTPVNNQIGVWTGDGTLEGDSALTFDTTTDTLAIGASGKLAFGAVNILSDSAGTTTLQNIDAIDATTEATIESAIDTLANLTSIQGRTITLADAGADALLGWDDSANAYQNLSATDVRIALGLATTDSPQFTALNIGNASDTTITRVSAGVIAVEGATVATLSASNTWTGVNDFGGATSLEIPNGAGGTTVNAAGEITIDTTSGTLNYYDGTAERVLEPLITKIITVESPTSSEDISIGYLESASTLVRIRAVCTGSSPSVTWTLRHSTTDRSATGTEAVTGGTTTTSTTTGSNVTSFNDATMTAGWYWLETTATSGTITSISFIIEYRQDA